MEVDPRHSNPCLPYGLACQSGLTEQLGVGPGNRGFPPGLSSIHLFPPAPGSVRGRQVQPTQQQAHTPGPEHLPGCAARVIHVCDATCHLPRAGRLGTVTAQPLRAPPRCQPPQPGQRAEDGPTAAQGQGGWGGRTDGRTDGEAGKPPQDSCARALELVLKAAGQEVGRGVGPAVSRGCSHAQVP